LPARAADNVVAGGGCFGGRNGSGHGGSPSVLMVYVLYVTSLYNIIIYDKSQV
jgi:hypothetical protein